MANIIPVPSLNGESDSFEFGKDTNVPTWPAGGSVRDEYNTAPFIDQSRDQLDSESDSGNKTFGGT